LRPKCLVLDGKTLDVILAHAPHGLVAVRQDDADALDLAVHWAAGRITLALPVAR
jgi:hypothetical protein